jgi:TonB family protein
MAARVLLYRPTARWHTWIAFVLAAVIHVTAVVLARNESAPVAFPGPTDNGVDVAFDPTPDAPAPDLVEPASSDVPPPAERDETFVEENSTPALSRQKKVKPVPRAANAAAIRGGPAPTFGEVKVLAIYAPRPPYPYEARRQRSTGSGLVLLRIDVSTGSVTEARMVQSTGSAVLDNSAVNTLGRWRFKPGTMTNVQVPITYTLTGASY